MRWGTGGAAAVQARPETPVKCVLDLPRLVDHLEYSFNAINTIDLVLTILIDYAPILLVRDERATKARATRARTKHDVNGWTRAHRFISSRWVPGDPRGEVDDSSLPSGHARTRVGKWGNCPPSNCILERTTGERYAMLFDLKRPHHLSLFIKTRRLLSIGGNKRPPLSLVWCCCCCQTYPLVVGPQICSRHTKTGAKHTHLTRERTREKGGGG